MSLAEFETAEMVNKLGYSFEVESDHQDWDLAVDGIRSIQRQLDGLRKLAWQRMNSSEIFAKFLLNEASFVKLPQ